MNKILDYIKYGLIILLAGILLSLGGAIYNKVEKKVIEQAGVMGVGQTYVNVMPLIDGATATTTSSTLPQALFSQDYQYIKIAVETTGNASGTIKIPGTILDTPVDPTSTSTITNQWTNMELIDTEDGSSYDGDTGIVVSGTDIHKTFRINVDLTSWTMPIITNYSTGTFYVYAVARSE